MTPERWQQIDKLLEQVLEQEPDRRAAFLNEACRGDPELRREVETLLAAHDQGGSLLSSPALGAPARSADSPQSLMGQSVGHYQILSRLGEGGMGIVYKARDTHLDRFVAIKVLPPELMADPGRKRRFVQEAKAASALNHPNIITIHDIASENGQEFIVMEFIGGKTLEQLISRRGLRLQEVVNYATQIADALAKAHAVGIIHRDLKPGNIMVTEEGLVKVLDFGLAKLTERPRVEENESTMLLPQTEEGMILGTASYMSPEQAAGKPVDARSDVFSFGSVLYEMVTGQRAFQGESKMSTLAAIMNQEPKSAREIARMLPPDLDKIITRCLRKEPSRRSQSMADVKVALEELKEESDSGLLGTTEGGDFLGKPRRVSALQWVTLAVAGLSLAVAGWFWLGGSKTAPLEGSRTPVPLTTYSGWELSPSFSPDGKQVAFSLAKTGPDGHGDIYVKKNVDIYIKQIGVEEPFQLTDNPAPDLNPAWSPDGQIIAFGRQLTPERVAYIVKPQRGGPERTVAEFAWRADTAAFGVPFSISPKCAWTPDSKSLVVVGMNPEQRAALFLVFLETGEKRQLVDPPTSMGDADPAISPDGQALAFSRIDPGRRCDLWLLSLSEDFTPQGKPERLTSDNPINRNPAWTTAGREIVFASGTNWFADRSLFKLQASQGAKAVRLAFAGELVDHPAISSQGNRLAYDINDVSRTDYHIWRVEVPGAGASPKEAMRFLSSTRGESEPRFSPDGKKIAFASHRSGPPEIWVCNNDGSHVFPLTSFGGPVTNRPRWSPDGERIVFYSDAKGNRDIYVTRADGGGLTQLTTGPSTDTNPDWSASGQWIYFESDRSGRQQLWKLSVAGADAVLVSEIGGSSPVESRDGKFLYYNKGWPDTYGVWRVPTRGGAEIPVIDSLHPTGGWVVVSEGIYFISRPNETGISYIRFRDFATGSDRAVVPIKGRPYWGLSISPDRRTFLYSLSDESGSDLMLVENFR